VNKRKPLKARAKAWADKNTGKKQGKEVAAWMAGYKAAQSDAFAKTYSRKVCSHCGQPKDGHRHVFECDVDFRTLLTGLTKEFTALAKSTDPKRKKEAL
jgi:hypothetical protein